MGDGDNPRKIQRGNSLDAQVFKDATIIVEVDDPDSVISLYVEGGHLGFYDVALIALEYGAEICVRGHSDNG